MIFLVFCIVGFFLTILVSIDKTFWTSGDTAPRGREIFTHANIEYEFGTNNILTAILILKKALIATYPQSAKYLYLLKHFV
jgi:hypothetical protein